MGCAWTTQSSALRMSMNLVAFLLVIALSVFLVFKRSKITYIFALVILICAGVFVYVTFRDSLSVGQSDAWCYKTDLEGVPWIGGQPDVHCTPYWSLVWVCLLDGCSTLTLVAVVVFDILLYRSPRKSSYTSRIEETALLDEKQMTTMDESPKDKKKEKTTYRDKIVFSSEVDFSNRDKRYASHDEEDNSDEPTNKSGGENAAILTPSSSTSTKSSWWSFKSNRQQQSAPVPMPGEIDFTNKNSIAAAQTVTPQQEPQKPSPAVAPPAATTTSSTAAAPLIDFSKPRN